MKTGTKTLTPTISLVITGKGAGTEDHPGLGIEGAALCRVGAERTNGRVESSRRMKEILKVEGAEVVEEWVPGREEVVKGACHQDRGGEEVVPEGSVTGENLERGAKELKDPQEKQEVWGRLILGILLVRNNKIRGKGIISYKTKMLLIMQVRSRPLSKALSLGRSGQ